jgi:hypothetical protein
MKQRRSYEKPLERKNREKVRGDPSRTQARAQESAARRAHSRHAQEEAAGRQEGRAVPGVRATAVNLNAAVIPSYQ